jgi:ATP-dependent DNA ligase
MLPRRIYIDSELFIQLDLSPEWVAEPKLNGWRCLIIRDEHGLFLWSRKHSLWGTVKYPYPNLRIDLNGVIPMNCMFDGELLDRRANDFGERIRETLVLFDCLVFEGKDVCDLPYSERRKLIETIQPSNHIRLAEQYDTGRAELYRKLVALGEEGIVFKKRTARYEYGYSLSPESPLWIKVKRPEKHFEVAV